MSPTTGSPSPILLGIECGGTRSVAIGAVVQDDGSLVSPTRVEAGPCNLRLVTDDALEAHFRSIAAQFPSPSGVGVGMAGVRDKADIQRVLNILGRVFPGVPAEADHDLESALCAADLDLRESGRHRVILLSGTGSCCYGRSSSGKTAKVGGWGHLLGDRGSAYDVVHRALRAAAHHLDHSGRWCRLGQRALRATGLNAPNDLIAWMQSATKTDVAALAPEVFEAASEGDAVARAVLADTVAILAEDAVACVRRLGPCREGADVVLAGSVVLRQAGFARRVAARVRKAVPRARVMPLERDSAWGAVVMGVRAWRRAGGNPANGDRPARPDRADGADRVDATCRIPGSRGLSPTELRNPASMELDRLPVERAVGLMLDEEARVAGAIRPHARELATLVRLVAAALGAGGRLIYVGAGTSGRLGVLDASECPPTFKSPPEWVQGIIAGGFPALHSAVEGAEDSPDQGAAAIAGRGVGPLDVVVGIAASGRTPFVWGALHEARRRGASTALLCFNPGIQPLRGGPPDVLLAIDTGPEVLTGSTRLKAGTATKVVLNILTTLAMVRRGKVVGNLMVDLNPSNAKLRDRAARIV
ncbi:MAG: N-acetylmuramic acid 6-phosphate etherase, partial [Verrucomicrobiota bacterium]